MSKSKNYTTISIRRDVAARLQEIMKKQPRDVSLSDYLESRLPKPQAKPFPEVDVFG